MMDNNTNDNKVKFNFEFRINQEALASFTHLKLFNGSNEVVDQGYGNMNTRIPRGLYKLRVEINEHMQDIDYRITADVSDSLDDIKISSVLPIEGFDNTHEYFSQPASEWSKKSTITGDEILNNDSSFFLFLRYSDPSLEFKKIKNPFKEYLLLNDKREVLFKINASNTKFSKDTAHLQGKGKEYFAWIAFHEKLPSGQYYFIYRGNKIKREMPIYIFHGWQTQLFMMIKNLPIFASARISIERQGFSMRSRESLQLDALIQKMHNGIFYLPDDLKQAAANGKWQNPMLGILAMYMYLLTDEKKDDGLFNMILDNLQSGILGDEAAPDIIALRLLLATHFKKEIPTQPLETPCMVAVGINAFLKASYKNPGLIPKGGIVEKMLNNMQSDSIWTTYSPLVVRVGQEALQMRADKKVSKFTEMPEDIKNLDEVLKKKEPKLISDNLDNNVGRNYIISYPKFNVEKEWVTANVLNKLAAKIDSETFDLANFAAQLHVTNNTIETNLKKLKKGKNLDIMVRAIFGGNEHKSEGHDKAMENIRRNLDNLKF
jgi:hypothetical protein